jgi:predicted RNA-binding Zn ribbon-like protein
VSGPESSDQAPGPLRLIQSFANTRGAEPAPDLLGTRQEAVGWLREAELLPAEAGLTGSEHAALLRLRDAVRDVLAAREDADAAARLTKGLADGRMVLTAGPAGTVQLASAARAAYPSVVAAIAIAIAGSAASGTWPRLKSCPDCGRAYYDGSASADAGGCSEHAA